ncbi:hypothetical protein KVG88_18520 [Pseudomonas sp. SWRI74]|jgi:hypothetical protein|uniref:Uncharacterized protein n=1 Tax=Pseudomonas azerbaijanoccidentalis TaxID=2842347 RepID=A0ABS6QT02_9PSED|nr:hypothetical protein [Pseudomonas azerbaijanoccidentalis]MBV4522060.1 hypothetical protein [Pseudomonas azerbaijanoccidentalis]MCK8663954.1 hypothetical protein [Pseudomonas azerbaijanoccidentalis]
MWDRSSFLLSRLQTPLLTTALIASVLALASCATVDAQTTAYVGVEHPAPTLANEVQIMRVAPTRPYVRLGEILIDASVDPAPPITQVEAKLREQAATLGADAVVVVYDQIQPVAAYVSGPLWSRDINTIQGRKLKGIAIKYQ